MRRKAEEMQRRKRLVRPHAEILDKRAWLFYCGG